ncbi:redox-regulated ATPase YchF [Campylobacter sp. MIT 21-1685]|uniref:redox-regulated ATPase YchF n=1 Tax=unclassified Campylobacter TaxID=2593542 RepID=UPI00224ADA52|nr:MULTISPECIES: redox-regulated ATPase YchF [unclassified Campylobacter]MCX2682840.1 redox-regulated ATPase YchF [Campylobacter sp. MIT 21-1684]MCX2751014.1 redox-regulated ATPase YchF [Campylobacter sp. MIT 21-1682]MCX2807321.1 redox-regulated ATPase YchF [Campylobacter sp. MIT 21-1685]
MSLCVGIVGLPNVGKSTTFNALTKAQNAQSANYPFCTIEPNKAMVKVPDTRLDELAKIVKPQKIIHSFIEFVDIAGLVRGASKGEGLGNKFLSNIRESEIILHLVRCFDEKNITHIEGNVDPLRDVEIINTELILADIEQLSKRKEKLAKEARTNAKEAKEKLELIDSLLHHLNQGFSANTFEKKDEKYQALIKELRLLSAKEVIYGANVDEESINEDNDYVKKLKTYATKHDHEVIKLCAKIEEELLSLSIDEGIEFLNSLGVKESGLEQIIRTSFSKLGLINYFTAGITEVHSWTIKKGYKAPKAASVIHNDFERGFIRAEVISFKDFIAYKGENGAKEAGKLRLEGKDYEVVDGDIIHFRFNV